MKGRNNFQRNWWVVGFFLSLGLFSCEKETFCFLEVCECDQIIEDCMPERKCVDFLVMEPGVIEKVSENLFIIVTEKTQSQRLAPCNLPADLKKDGLKVTFSGGEKEMFPEEEKENLAFVITWINPREF